MPDFISLQKIKYYSVLVLILFFSCTKEIINEGISGELKGRVWLHKPSSFNNNNSGALVTVEGSDPLLQTITDSAGEFSIKNLKTGIYDLVFSKDSFGTYKFYSYQFIGGNEPTLMMPVELFQLPDSKITVFKADTVRISSNNYQIELLGSLSDTDTFMLRYFVSDSSTVSYSNYLVTGYFYAFNKTDFSTSLNETYFKSFSGGTQLYIILYPSAYPFNMSYMDIITGNQIYNVTVNGASEVVPFKVPETLSSK
jgi:hypothetical protein